MKTPGTRGINKVVIYTTSAAGVLISSDVFPSPCTLEAREVVTEIPSLLLVNEIHLNDFRHEIVLSQFYHHWVRSVFLNMLWGNETHAC